MLNWLSNLCGGTITAKDLFLACIGFVFTVSLITAWGFLIAVAYTPHY